MGLWSETVGQGNSFGQSVANVLTPRDGLSYERGEIVDNEEGRAFEDTLPNRPTDNNTSNDNGASSQSVAVVPAAEEAGNPLDSDAILEMAKIAGLITSQADMEAIIADPNAFLSARNMTLADLVPVVDGDAEGTNLDPYNPAYDLGPDPTVVADTVDGIQSVDQAVNPGAETYVADTVSNLLTDETKVNAATGTVDADNLVNASDIEIDIAAENNGTGVLGNALEEFASQNISTIIDTTTPAGKALAERLGEGNYLDHKTTILGQMEIISNEFKDSNGMPKVPIWAQKMVRDVQRTIAFSGISGTAATAAYANAVMEATLGVAEKEAKFFQTITVENLDNRQEAIINKAKVLANFELGNLSTREAAAVSNAKAFLEMDLKNLDNEQQAEVIDKQAIVQALFEDQKAINAERLFTAEEANDLTKFYDELNASIDRHNSTEINTLKRFNVQETNDASEFNAEMSDIRDQFYSTMQYNIDVSNAKWRQTVEKTNTKMDFEAASADVKNSLDISQEAQNRLWDSVDSLLDYIFKGVDNEAGRDAMVLAAQLGAQGKGGSSGLLGMIGTLGAAYMQFGSDMRLKENIQYVETKNNIDWYTWEWNDEAKRLAWDHAPTYGVMAQQLQETHPHAVVKSRTGYLKVNYAALH